MLYSALLTLALVSIITPNEYNQVYAATADCTSRFTDMPHCQVISPNHALHWQISPDNTTITFGVDIVDIDATNWFGIGLSDEGGMRTADEWILKQDTNGKWVIQDSYTDDYGVPAADASQDVTLVGDVVVGQGGKGIAYKVSRGLKTCDTMDLEVKVDTLHAIIWAYGKQSNGAISQHCPTCRGNTYINLRKDPTFTSPPDPSDKSLLSAIMPNITVPAQSTTYYCINFQTPNDKKYHIIEYEGVAKTKYIHHMVVFACPKAPVQPFGQPYECTMSTECSVMLVWVPGSLSQAYPAEAGTAIGVGKNALQYMILQVHYNNPTLDAGSVDASGMNMYYTSQLRKYDVGVLVLGTFSLQIPGNSKEYTVLPSNTCQSSCTATFPGNLTLFSSMTHMHLLGHNQTLQHVRNGVELEPLLFRKNYDFGFQNYQALQGRTLMPGDELITTCGYIPTDGIRNKITTFGESTNDEMCFNFLQYYPKVVVDYCVTLENINTGMCGSIGMKNQVITPQTLRDPVQLKNKVDAWTRSKAKSKLDDGFFHTDDLVMANAKPFTPYVPPVCVPSLKLSSTNTTSTVSQTAISKSSSTSSSFKFDQWQFGTSFICSLLIVLVMKPF